MIDLDEKFECEKIDVTTKFDDNQETENESLAEKSTADDNNDNLHENQSGKIKGFQRDKSKNSIVCLDCGKCFKHKNSYNCHKRM